MTLIKGTCDVKGNLTVSMDKQIDNEISKILYHKKKSRLSPKVAIEVLFMEYDTYCKCFGNHINYFSEYIYKCKS